MRGSWPRIRTELAGLRDQIDEEDRITSIFAGIELLLARNGSDMAVD